MKLARFKVSGKQTWGVLDLEAGRLRHIRGELDQWAPALTADFNTKLDFDGNESALADVQLLAPLHPPGHIYWVGLNYPNWPKPAGTDSPVFFKPRSAMVGPDEVISFPQLIATQPQAYFVHEIELVAVIGRAVRDRDNAVEDVLGYTVGNSGTVRGNRAHVVGADLVGRSCARRSSAIGPWIVTRDEFGDGQPNLLMTLRINGEVRQRGRTDRMVWGMNKLLFETEIRSRLDCGDVVLTGTCGYVDCQDGLYQPNDQVEAQIERIGVLRNRLAETDTSPIHPSQRQCGPRRVPPFHPYPVPDEVLP